MKSPIAAYRVLSLPGSLWRDDCCGDSQSRRRLPKPTMPMLVANIFGANDFCQLRGLGDFVIIL